MSLTLLLFLAAIACCLGAAEVVMRHRSAIAKHTHPVNVLVVANAAIGATFGGLSWLMQPVVSPVALILWGIGMGLGCTVVAIAIIGLAFMILDLDKELHGE